jgi:alpha-galactosidase/6-phospho-beta-glucosidase family protein
MKITVIGSGSIFFTRRMVKGMVSSKYLSNAELVLVDIDEYKCVQMGEFCKKINEHYKANIKITYTTNRLEALPGSDYVILCFAINNYHYRETGTNLVKNYGIHVVSGETAGPSSVTRILRTVPEILNVARDIEKLCPNAYVINYVNPTNVIGTLLDRNTKLKTNSYCDGTYEVMNPCIYTYLGLPTNPNTELAKDHSEFQIKFGGINHFTFLFDLAKGNENLWEKFKTGLMKAAGTDGPESFARVEWDFCEIYNAWMSQMIHTIEYVRYFQGKGSNPQNDFVIYKWSLSERIRWMKSVWAEIAACNNGKISITEAMKDESTDMIAVVLDSIEGNKGKAFTVNVRNNGKIKNLPDNILVEVLGYFYKDKIDIPEVGYLPKGLAGLMGPFIEEQELALEAALTGNFQTVVKAIACDPLVMSLNDAKNIARDLFAIEEANLDRKWDSYWAGLSKGRY